MKLPTNEFCRFYVYGEDPSTLDIEAAGRSGRKMIYVNVHGYWSDVIQVYLTRDYRDGWQVSISHSSGGRLSKPDMKHYPNCVAIESDIDAEERFGYSLVAATVLARELQKHAPILEEFYQARLKEDRAAREAQRAAHEEAVKNDPAMGEAAAKALLAKACKSVVWNKPLSIYALTCGANDRYGVIVVSRMTNWTYRINQVKASKAEVIALLATCSQNSYIKGEQS